MILKDLMNGFHEHFPNNRPGKIVVTIPINYNIHQREATLRACKIAGLENVELLHEPSASIIEYARNYKGHFDEHKKVLVIDFGGGTLDVCFCRVNNDRVEVWENGGDENFGGNDCDRVMYDLLLEKMKEENIDDEFFKKFD